MTRVLLATALLWAAAAAMRVAPATRQDPHRPPVGGPVRFTTAETCMACHNGLTTSRGEDISIGTDWRGSIMANSSRDPYWQAAVRRETLDHPDAAAEIEDECAVCHMPMARAEARAAGRPGRIFEHLSAGTDDDESRLAHDGVSCTMCHQISGRNLGTPSSFTGGFELEPGSGGTPTVFGPFDIDAGRTRVMESAAGFRPRAGAHVRQSEMCATCHTLYTDARGEQGEVVGRLPEQVPYLEWQHSAFPAERQTCQSCHMPVVREDTAIASVLGQPRQGVARHIFRGGNVFMLRMLNRYRHELGVAAQPQELEASARWTLQQLEMETASVTIERAVLAAGRVEADVAVRNLAGHKLPSGYPSRRAWLELIVRDAAGRTIFHSGRVSGDGSIEGNDNDSDPARYEPHHAVIREAGQVPIYESVMIDSRGAVTTGLLRGVRYVKDNRLLPRGFDKVSAPADIAVVGLAAGDQDFNGGGDTIRYSIDVGASPGPFTIDAALQFQSIGYRWAQNLKPYDAPETKRFVSYYESMSGAATVALSRTGAAIAGSK